jgi:hypothetical protein
VSTGTSPKLSSLLDWRFPVTAVIAAVATLMINSFSLGAWKSKQEEDVNTNTKRIDILVEIVREDHDIVIRMDENIKQILKTLEEQRD